MDGDVTLIGSLVAAIGTLSGALVWAVKGWMKEKDSKVRLLKDIFAMTQGDKPEGGDNA